MSQSSAVALAIENAAQTLEGADPEDILTWATAEYDSRIVLACSFGGPSGLVALDMTLRVAPATPVYYLDTGLLFAETHELLERIASFYDIVPIAVVPELSLGAQAERHGDELWRRDPDACCAMRKVDPQRAFLANYAAWISGIRRDQSSERAQTPVVQWDAQFDCVKINPLAGWNERMVWTYLRAHGLPYNPLHDRGYASIGCRPCTRPVAAHESLRAGRWPGIGKTECGLHASATLAAAQ